MTSLEVAAERPPFWRNVKVIGWAFQLAVLAVVVGFVAWIVSNVRTNSESQNIPTGFGFLDQPAGFPISGNSFRESQPVREAIIQGTLNTIRVAVVGIVLATVLGILLGIARLSGNWLLRTISTVYVEVLRNVPLLAVVTFAYLGLVLATLPRVQNSWEFGGSFILNVRGVTVPWITGRGWLLLVVLAIAAVAAWGVARWRRAASERTGEAARQGLWAAPVFLLIAFWGAVAAGIGTSFPEIDGRRAVGGITMQPEYFALLVALTLYTASHIAEIVRGSIQAVPRGQGEAASALALSGFQRMRLVVLPQAMRIAIPPLGNQYLNLVKNSSLGFVISYFELTKVTATAQGTRAPAIPAYLTALLIYLAMSLVVSLFVNLGNRRLAVVDR